MKNMINKNPESAILSLPDWSGGPARLVKRAIELRAQRGAKAIK